MHGLPRISEAAAIALHAADYMASREGLSSSQEIARGLGVSYNHLAKVLQRLTRAGLVSPARGPKGGFTLSPSGRAARAGDYVEAVDGPMKLAGCLMKAKVCRRRECMFGGFLAGTNRRFEAVMKKKISEFSKRK
ncbi:MAG: BadM/Rrf2 family transcriptional regulator [Elusimicrobia bacterium]|nr:MAG: BadM/Rrf2 family transcriptional regulator [Elusimicrobiota bacterium]KAF0157131.1 MAG: BadM/Rrf2 family transcriptional regulator [Elusimicrobiota bacterium]